MRSVLLAAMAVVLICLCGCMDNSIDPEPEEDLSEPELASSVPSADETDVDPLVHIEITFAEDVSVDSFSLTTAIGNTEIDGTLEETDSRNFTFVPDRPLDYNKAYVAAMSNVRKVTNDNEIDVSISFTTATASYNYYSTPDSHDHDVGGSSFVGITTDGMMHLIYYNATDSEVHVTSTETGEFFLDPLMLAAGIDGPDVFAAAFDDSDVLHLAYVSTVADVEALRYAAFADVRNVEGIVPEVLDPDIGIDFLSMDIDDDGMIHVAYYDETNQRLKYATNSSGAWQAEVADDPGDLADETGKYTSIRVDTAGLVHVSYYEFHPSNLNGNLKYAVRDVLGSWQVSSIDTTGDTGIHTSLQIYDGAIYIAHYDPDSSSINLISNETGSWNSAAVVAGITSEAKPAFVVDATGMMHLSYYKRLSGLMKLCYASRIWEWSTDMAVDESGIGDGVRSSILVDSEAKVHISYYDVTDRDLKLANQD